MNTVLENDGGQQLSSGLFGAVLGAIVLIVISLVVAWITIWNQTRATEKQLAQQRLLSGRALTQQQSEFSGAMQAQRAGLQRQLEEQRKALNRQLESQSEMLELQLQEQRAEARKSREIAAIADILAAAGTIVEACVGGAEAINRQKTVFDAAALRWQIDLEDQSMGDEIAQWGFVLAVAATGVALETLDGGNVKDMRGVLFSAKSTLDSCLQRWIVGDDAIRALLLKRLVEARKSAEAKRPTQGT